MRILKELKDYRRYKKIHQSIMKELFASIEHSKRLVSIDPTDQFQQGVMMGKIWATEDAYKAFIMNNEEYRDNYDKLSEYKDFIGNIINTYYKDADKQSNNTDEQK